MVIVIKVKLGSKRGIKVKKNLGVIRLNWREEVVLEMENLHMSLIERGTMGNA